MLHSACTSNSKKPYDLGRPYLALEIEKRGCEAQKPFFLTQQTLALKTISLLWNQNLCFWSQNMNIASLHFCIKILIFPKSMEACGWIGQRGESEKTIKVYYIYIFLKLFSLNTNLQFNFFLRKDLNNKFYHTRTCYIV